MVKHCTQCGEPQPSDARFCPKCGASIVPAGGADPMIGKVVAGRYLLTEKLGSGGSGTIYRAEHTTLAKKVAVKILHTQLSQDDHAIERFRREATTVGEIDNEHILNVLDFGRAEDNRLFFAMEFLDGETLAKVIDRDEKLPVRRVLDIATQVGEALMEAHGLGYIHRDLRPRNVFLTTKKGRADFVKLLDFGVAKLVLPSSEAKQTALGMNFGDPRYMSPEQARGEPVDRRADIYSLGVIMFEMLTGVPPYAGKTFDVLQKVLDAPVPTLRDKRPDCPEWLETVVQRALAKKADERFITVLKLLECMKGEKEPVAADESERDAHAKLTATAQIKAVGQAFAAQGPATTKPAETQALSTLGSHDKDKDKDKGVDRREKKTLLAPADAPPVASAAPPAAPAAPLNVSASSEKTAQDRLPPLGAQPSAPTLVNDDHPTIPIQKMAPPAPLPPPPATPPSATSKAPRVDPSGTWFTESGEHKAVERAPGAWDDDDDYPPRKNRQGLIIGGVMGGLMLVGAVVIFLLPKPPKKAEGGETAKVETKEAPKPAEPPKPPEPAPAPVANTAPAPVANAAPAPVANAAPAPEPPKPAVAFAPPPKPEPPKPEPPKAEPPKAEPPKPVAKIEPKPEPKPEPKVAKAEPKAEPKPTKLAAAEPMKPERKKAAAPLPNGFKDPFADSSAKKAGAAESAQAEFFVKLGRQKLASGDLGAASTNFNKAREYDTRSPDAFAGLGEVAFEQHDYNGASVHLKQALRLSPNRPRYLVLLGQTYYKLGRPKDAVAEYKKALRIDPNNSEAQRGLEVAERKLAQGG